MSATKPSTVDGVVLVHGMWGVPDDWRWVQDLLEARGTAVSVPDLPSHRRPAAGLAEDVEEVKAAIRAAGRAVVVVGWSYGCDVAGVAAAGEPNATRLLYVSSVPQPRQPGSRNDMIFDNDPAFVCERVADVRVVECDHFIPFNLPRLVVETVLERTGGSR